MSNSVELVSTGQVLVQEVSEQVIELQVPSAPVTVEVVTAGPQGAPGASGVSTLAALSDVNTINKVDKSLLIYDSATSMWVGSEANTAITLTDGGNF